MVKRILKIVGIVFASIVGFTGAVFGTMALMGKFDTPIVFPNSLQFVDNEQTIVYNEALDTEDNPLWYSFTLNGFSDSGDQVNQKNCYIYFDNNVGNDLITLYDKNKVKIEPVNNRYLIECDEPVYYRLRDVDDSHFNKTNYGKVVLKARDEKNQIQSNTLTIWIDRTVNDIALVSDKDDFDDNTQIITLGLDGVQRFEFESTPSHALEPVSNRDEKIVEIYYLDPADASDYVLIDDSIIDSGIYPFLSNDNGTYVFSTSTSGMYRFRIAVFESYQARVDYLSDSNNAEKQNHERISQMVNRQVNISVINSDIIEVGMNVANVGFNLYTDNNYITLNGEDGVAGSNSNNLQLYMKNKNENYTNVRFNEVVFNTIDDHYSTSNITFVNEVSPGDSFIVDNSTTTYTSASMQTGDLTSGFKVYNFTLDNKVIYNTNGIKRTLVKNITFGEDPDTKTYVSGLGAVVLKEVTTADGTVYSLERLLSGSYLGLYEVDETSGISYSTATFDYSVGAPINSGNTKSWNVVIKQQPNADRVDLGMLVVNNSGSYYFDSVEAKFNTVDLQYEFISQDYDLSVRYIKSNNDIYTRNYGELSVEEIVNITSGTYDACVFVTPLSAKYDIDVLEEVVYEVEGNKYCLVGYFNGTEFVNRVRAREGATNADTKIYMLQLKNRYGSTAEDTVEAHLYNYAVFTYYKVVEGAVDPTYQLTLTYNLGDGLFYANDGINQYIEDTEFTFNNSTELTLGEDTYQFNNVTYNTATIIEEPTEPDSDTEPDAGSESEGGVKLTADIVVNAFLALDKAIDIDVYYTINPDTIDFNYKLQSGDNVGVKHEDGKYYANEETDGYCGFFTSANYLMFEDMLSTNDWQVFARLYDSNGNVLGDNSTHLEIVESSVFMGDEILGLIHKGVQINFNTEGYIETNYLTLVFKYNNTEVESNPLHIKSTEPTDIKVQYKDASTDFTANLADNDLSVSQDVYIKIIVGYDMASSEYTYTYQLVGKVSGVETVLQDVTNLGSVLKNGGWFIVEPSDVNVDHTIAFSSVDSTMFTISKQETATIDEPIDEPTEPVEPETPSADSYSVVVKKLGNTAMYLISGKVSKYIKVVIEAKEGFGFEDISNNLDADTTNDTTTKSNSFDISKLVQYTYLNSPISINNKYVNAELTVLSSGAGATKIVPVDTESDGVIDFIYVVLSSYDSDDYDSNHLLKLYHNADVWTLVRNTANIHTSFTVRLTLTTLVGKSQTLTLVFDSNMAVDKNPSWNSDLVYVGTAVLLAVEYNTDSYEGSDTPIYLLKNQTGDGTFTVLVNGTTEVENKDNLYTHTFDTAGDYTIKFTLGGTTITRTVKVLPNVIYRAHREDLYSNTTYNTLGYDVDETDNTALLQLSAFKTKDADDNPIVYGKDGVQYTNKAGEYLTSYLADISDTDGITITVTDSAFNYTGETVITRWLQSINSSQISQFTVAYDGTPIARDLSIVIYSAVTTTKSEISIIANKSEDITGDDYLGLVQHFSENGTITLANVVSEDTDNFSVTSGLLVYNGTVTSDTSYTVTLVFYWNDDSDTALTWTGEVVVTPYMPELVDNPATIYSNASNYDFLSVFFDFDVVNGDDYIKEIIFHNSQGSEITFSSIGYKSDKSSTTAMATISDISGDSLDVIVNVDITYILGGTYTYPLNVTIMNRHDMRMYYPFEDLKTSESIYLFKDANDAYNVAGEASTTVRFSGKNYEPVLVGDSIDFASNEYLRQRITVKDCISDTLVVNPSLDIELVGYENNLIYNYLNISITDNVVTFNVKSGFDGGSSLVIVLKITTEEGDYDYYFVRLYNNASGVAVGLKNDRVNLIGNDYECTDTSVPYITDNTLFNSQVLDNVLFNNKYGVSVSSINPLANISIYLLDARDINGNLIVTETDLYNLVTGNIPTDTEYTTITLGFVYINGKTQFYIGSITINVQPKDHETVNTELIEGSDVPVVTNRDWNNTSAINNGHYTKTLDINDKTFALPFTVGAHTLSSAKLVEGNDFKDENELVKVDGSGRLTIKTHPTHDYEFTVRYVYAKDSVDSLTLYVHYTLEAFVFDSSDASFTVGAYSEVLHDFDNSLAFSAIVPDYEAEEDVNFTWSASGDNDDKVDYVDNKFVFTQGTEKYSVDITLTMTGLIGQPTKLVTVTVLTNITTSQSSGAGSGKDGSSAVSTSPTGNYVGESAGVGSTLAVTKKAFDKDGNETDVSTDIVTYQYIIAGLTITVESNDSLLIEVDDNYTNYIVGYNNGITIDSTSTIKFTHSVTPEIIPLYIHVVHSTNGKYKANDTSGAAIDLVLPLYVKIAKTYDGLVAQYIWDGAHYENIMSEDSIEDLKSQLFGDTDDGNPSRLALKIDDNTIYSVGDYFDPTRMGFIGDGNIANPNYISVTAGESLSYDNLLDTLKATKVTESIVTTGVELRTKSGETLCTYEYHILPTDALLTYDRDLPTGTTDGKDYATILIEDTDSVLTFNPTATTIGTLNDSHNNLFSLTVKDSVGNNKDASKESGDTSAIRYRYTDGSYIFTIIFNTSTKELSVEIDRSAGSTLSLYFIHDLTIYLEGRATAYALRLAIFNATAEGISTTDTVYGDTTINLIEDNKIMVKPNIQGSLEIGYELMTDNSSYYIVGTGDTQYIEDVDNPLYVLNAGTNRLTINDVGVNVYSYNVFKVSAVVSSTSYYLGKVNYNMNVLPNLQFATMNATNEYDDWVDNAKSSSYTLLQPKLNTSEPDYKFNYQLDLTEAINGLGLKLYRPRGGKTLNVAESVKIYASEDVVINGTVITFDTDFSGELTLELHVETDNGTYIAYWYLEIEGFVTFTYADVTGEDQIVERAGSPYVSGEDVTAISSSGAGIIMETQDDIEDTLTISITSADYIVSTDASTIDASALDWDSKTGTINVTYEDSINRVTLRLPNVPESAGPNYTKYLVTIKFTVNYIKDSYTIDTKTLYTTYRVQNSLSVTVTDAYKVGIDIDANEDIGNNNDLRLLYFAEEYYDNTNTYKFVKYLGVNTDNTTTNILLDVYTNTGIGGEINYTYQTTLYYNDTESDSDNDVFSNINGHTAKVSYKNDSIEYDSTVYTIDDYKTCGNTDTNATLFTVSMDSIEKFMSYVTGINTVQFSNMTGYNTGYTSNRTGEPSYDSANKTLKYELKHLNNGIWGITLDNGGKALFNNEFRADLQLMSADDIVVKTVEAYNDATMSGFRLYTDSKITPNTTDIKVSDIFLERWITCKDTQYTYENIMAMPLIGVTNTNTPGDWTSVDRVGTKGSVVAEFSIPNGTDTATVYEVYKATYSTDSSTNEIYSLSADFYYVYSTTGKIVVPRYSGINSSSEVFTVAFGSQISLDDKFATYSMTGNAFEKQDYNSSKLTAVVMKLNEGDVSNVMDKQITVDTDKLIRYKDANPAKTFVKCSYTATYDGVTVLFNIRYVLPTSVTILTNNSETRYTLDYPSDSASIDLKDYLSYSADGVSSSIIDGDLTNITITSNTQGSKFTIDNGVVSITRNALDAYKTANASATEYLEQFVIKTGMDELTITISVNLS